MGVTAPTANHATVVRDSGSQVTVRLRAASFNGKGLRPELEGASWDRLRELAYESHGA